jgi:hypothetical protein
MSCGDSRLRLSSKAKRARLVFRRKTIGRTTRKNDSGFEQNLLRQAGTDHKLTSILGEENLPDSVPQAAFRAGLHLGLFDDLCAALHADARLRALILVK